VLSRTALIGIVERHTINNIQRLVIARHRSITSDHNPTATGSSRGIIRDTNPGNFTGKGIAQVYITRLGKLIPLYPGGRITQSFRFAFNPQRAYDDLIQRIGFRSKGNVHYWIITNSHLLSSITDIGENKDFSFFRFDFVDSVGRSLNGLLLSLNHDGNAG